MPMQVEDIEAFIQILRQDPELRRRVFLAILPEEFYTLPAKVDKIEQDVTELRRDVAELRAGQEELRAGQEELRKAQERSEARIARLEDRTGKLLGWELESRYASRPHSYFGRVLRRARAVDMNDALEQSRAHLSEEELHELTLVDVLITGRSESSPITDLVVAVEVSNKIEVGDVTRAAYRASLMRKVGFKCIPAVGGAEITNRARSEAERLRVVVILDGGMQGWDQAVALLTE